MSTRARRPRSSALAEAQPEQRRAQPPSSPRLEDRYKRALADLDNYRKRSAREVERRVAEVREALLRDWLEAVDSVERALRMQPDGPCADGLRAVLEQMDGVLARQGVRADRRGRRAVRPRAPRGRRGREPSTTSPTARSSRCARSGFALGDRVLRPAQVVVAPRARATSR